jgi:hypothetical protein
MTPWCLRWISALAALLALAGGLLVSGCASPVPTALAVPLLQDTLLGDPARPADADAALAIDEPMRAYVRGLLATAVRDRGRPQALADALYQRGDLQLHYDDAYTRNAAQAFAARSGNCLSLVLMTAALAREMGLDVVFQSAGVGESHGRSGDLLFYAGHVNLVLAPRYTRLQSLGVHLVRDPDSLQIDFLPPELARGLRSEPIAEARVLAMYLNNRAVEALRDETPARAYAWVREALRRDAGFWPARW